MEELEISGISAEEIAEQYGTPVYVYNLEKIRDQYRKLVSAFSQQTENFSINYAVKANPNPEIISLLAEEGAGFDCAARAELEVAMANQEPENMIYTAPFPPQEELEYAAEREVTVNFNSIQDFHRLDEKPERVSFRIDPGIGQGDFGLKLGGGSPIDVHTEMEYLDVKLNGEWTWEIEDDFSGFIFGVEGQGTVKDQEFGKGDVLTVKQAEKIQLESDEKLRVVAVQGEPHNQPIRQQGPYVF